MRNFLSKKRFWLAASTHKEKKLFCIKTHIKIKKKYKILLQLLHQDILIELMKLKNYVKKI